jgi:2-hydroxy-6-oxonona-2,4-dienedioate hydrolase
MLTRFIDVDGVETRAVTAGNAGAPVMLIHGIGLAADIWYPTLRGLAQDHIVVAPDLLWHGFTGGAELAPNTSPHAAMLSHLEHTADALGLDEYAVAGSSFGALLATLLSLRNPTRVTKLVIVGSGSCFDDEASLATMLANAHANAARAIRAGTEEAWRVRLENICFDPAAVSNDIISPMVAAYARHGALDRFERFMNARRDLDLERPFRVIDRLEEIALPTLVVWGKQEMRGDLEAATAAVQRIAAAELAVYDHCGHLPFLERPNRFNEDLRRFLAPAQGAPAASARH